MTREDIKKIFPDVTDGQLNQLLNQHNTEIAKERAKSDQYKEIAGKYEQLEQENTNLQKRLDEAEQGNMTELEKVTKALDKANQQITDLKRSAEIKDRRTAAAEKFKVSVDQASQIVKDDGSLDFDLLGQIMTDKEAAAALAKEKEIADASKNPNGGGKGGSGENDMTSAQKLADKIYGSQKSSSADIISKYTGGK